MEKIRKPNRSDPIDARCHKMGIDTGILDKNGVPIKTGDYVKYYGDDCIILFSTELKKYVACRIKYCHHFDIYYWDAYYSIYENFDASHRLNCEVVSRFKRPFPKKNTIPTETMYGYRSFLMEFLLNN